MNIDHDPQSLRRLERKMDTLTLLVGVQTLLLVVITIAYLLKMSGYLFFFLLVAIPILVIFRRSLPQWPGSMYRLWNRWLGRSSHPVEAMSRPVSSVSRRRRRADAGS